MYPDAATSRRLTFWNLLFPFMNWKFPLLMWPAYWLFIWILDFNARLTPGASLATELGGRPLGDAVIAYWRLVLVSPWGLLLVGLALLGYRYFAAVKNPVGRFLMGGAHALANAVTVTLTTCIVVRATAGHWPETVRDFSDVLTAGGLIGLAAAISALMSAFTFGLYLLVSLLLLNRHYNEAFSSIGHRGYKGFLRMRIAADGRLTLYPVGLTKVPFDRRAEPGNPPLHPHLIEPPVEIG